MIIKIFQNINLLAVKKSIVVNKNGILIIISLILLIVILSFYFKEQLSISKKATLELENKLSKTSFLLKSLKEEDQYKINKELKIRTDAIESLYKFVIDSYQKIVDLKIQKQDTSPLDKELALNLNYIAKINYASASSGLKNLQVNIKKKQDDWALAQVKTLSVAQSIVQSNTAPSSGFSVQGVKTNTGVFTTYIVAADLNSTKVVVDTASDGDCGNNCPALALSDYVARSGAFAGINGSYFCPPEYPSCAGKTNSFDLLVMNKNKVYFNSSNNVYSTNPAVIFSGNSARFVSKALEWGRDTGVDAVLSNFPLLVSGGNVVYSGGGDPKFLPKGPRTFIANKGNMVYMGIIFNATMQDSAEVLKTLGIDNALNLDQGGSTALWYGGYKAGPGRNIPNALLFIRK